MALRPNAVLNALICRCGWAVVGKDSGIPSGIDYAVAGPLTGTVLPRGRSNRRPGGGVLAGARSGDSTGPGADAGSAGGTVWGEPDPAGGAPARDPHPARPGSGGRGAATGAAGGRHLPAFRRAGVRVAAGARDRVPGAVRVRDVLPAGAGARPLDRRVRRGRAVGAAGSGGARRVRGGQCAGPAARAVPVRRGGVGRLPGGPDRREHLRGVRHGQLGCRRRSAGTRSRISPR